MNKVVIEISGGLGNQLFQVSAADWLQKNGYTAIIDPIQNEVNKIRKNDVRCLVQKLGIGYLDRSNLQLKICSAPVFRTFYFRYLKMQSSHEFANFLPPTIKPKYKIQRLSGYWQTKLTTDNVKKILDISVGAQRKDDAIAVHVRRGDYLTPQHSIHGVLGGEYYLDAIKSLMETKHRKSIILFTDSPEIVRTEKWINEIPTENLEFYRSKSPWETLLEMARFRSIICSNSTFSWWAAYLGQPKEIMLPDKWFRDIPIPACLRFPESKIINSEFTVL